MKRCDLKQLNDAEGKVQYQIKISNRSEALENLDDNVDINKAWLRKYDKIPANESPGYYELKQHKV
jgi:hypothetical protein